MAPPRSRKSRLAAAAAASNIPPPPPPNPSNTTNDNNEQPTTTSSTAVAPGSKGKRVSTAVGCLREVNLDFESNDRSNFMGGGSNDEELLIDRDDEVVSVDGNGNTAVAQADSEVLTNTPTSDEYQDGDPYAFSSSSKPNNHNHDGDEQQQVKRENEGSLIESSFTNVNVMDIEYEARMADETVGNNGSVSVLDGGGGRLFNDDTVDGESGDDDSDDGDSEHSDDDMNESNYSDVECENMNDDVNDTNTTLDITNQSNTHNNDMNNDTNNEDESYLDVDMESDQDSDKENDDNELSPIPPRPIQILKKNLGVKFEGCKDSPKLIASPLLKKPLSAKKDTISVNGGKDKSRNLEVYLRIRPTLDVTSSSSSSSSSTTASSTTIQVLPSSPSKTTTSTTTRTKSDVTTVRTIPPSNSWAAKASNSVASSSSSSSSMLKGQGRTSKSSTDKDTNDRLSTSSLPSSDTFNNNDDAPHPPQQLGAGASAGAVKEYNFSSVFGTDSVQSDVYKRTAGEVVMGMFLPFNSNASNATTGTTISNNAKKNTTTSNNTANANANASTSSASNTKQRLLQPSKSSLLFAYGITNSGKTHTILGTPETPGILPLALADIMNRIEAEELNGVSASVGAGVSAGVGGGGSVNANVSGNVGFKSPIKTANGTPNTTGGSGKKQKRWDISTSTTNLLNSNANANATLNTAIPTSTTNANANASSSNSNTNTAVGGKRELFMSYLEIYNEKVYDLIGPSGLPPNLPPNLPGTGNTNNNGKNKNSKNSKNASAKDKGEETYKKIPLKLRDQNGSIIVQGLSKHVVSSVSYGLSLSKLAGDRRNTDGTVLNGESSRSHCVCQLEIISTPSSSPSSSTENAATGAAGNGGKTSSIFWIVDLAGSERSKRTAAGGKQQREGSSINTSLMKLWRCLKQMRVNQSQNQTQTGLSKKGSGSGSSAAAVDASKTSGSSGSGVGVVPFRESKLTHLFMNHLSNTTPTTTTNVNGGRTIMIVCVNPSKEDYDETQHVLSYAALAQSVRLSTSGYNGNGNGGLIGGSAGGGNLGQTHDSNGRRIKNGNNAAGNGNGALEGIPEEALVHTHGRSKNAKGGNTKRRSHGGKRRSASSSSNILTMASSSSSSQSNNNTSLDFQKLQTENTSLRQILASLQTRLLTTESSIRSEVASEFQLQLSLLHSQYTALRLDSERQRQIGATPGRSVRKLQVERANLYVDELEEKVRECEDDAIRVNKAHNVVVEGLKGEIEGLKKSLNESLSFRMARGNSSSVPEDFMNVPVFEVGEIGKMFGNGQNQGGMFGGNADDDDAEGGEDEDDIDDDATVKLCDNDDVNDEDEEDAEIDLNNNDDDDEITDLTTTSEDAEVDTKIEVVPAPTNPKPSTSTRPRRTRCSDVATIIRIKKEPGQTTSKFDVIDGTSGVNVVSSIVSNPGRDGFNSSSTLGLGKGKVEGKRVGKRLMEIVGSTFRSNKGEKGGESSSSSSSSCATASNETGGGKKRDSEEMLSNNDNDEKVEVVKKSNGDDDSLFNSENLNFYDKLRKEDSIEKKRKIHEASIPLGDGNPIFSPGCTTKVKRERLSENSRLSTSSAGRSPLANLSPNTNTTTTNTIPLKKTETPTPTSPSSRGTPPKDCKGRPATWNIKSNAWYYARGRGGAPCGEGGRKMTWCSDSGVWVENEF